VLPNEESLVAVLSFQLAHIALGHHIDTRYAFNDRLLFPDSASFQRITMDHSVPDDESAAKKGVELFQHSYIKDKAAGVGLFFEQLQAAKRTCLRSSLRAWAIPSCARTAPPGSLLLRRERRSWTWTTCSRSPRFRSTAA
jgi:hypothetical protein